MTRTSRTRNAMRRTLEGAARSTSGPVAVAQGVGDVPTRTGVRLRSVFATRSAIAEPATPAAGGGGAFYEQDESVRDLSGTTVVEDVPAAPPALEESRTATLAPVRHAEDDDARRAWERVVRMFHDAADDPAVSARVGRAEIAVRLYALDVEGEAFVLDANGDVNVCDGSASYDAEIGLGTADLERLGEGRLRMAMAIAAGRAPFSGPVRRFLGVLPVIQAMVRPPVSVGSAYADDAPEAVR